MPEFVGWPKIARLNRDIVITEKLDGTNAAIGITDNGDIYAQSRKRIITPDADNYGFARWVQDNAAELSKLGPGLHFGEWWGQGIQRNYGLDEKRFSLFNTERWQMDELPAIVHMVPVIYRGPFDQDEIGLALESLYFGSYAAPDFMQPEGIVIYHTAARSMFKVTLENDEKPKGSA